MSNSAEDYKKIFESALVPIFRKDHKGKVLVRNAAFVKLLELDKNEEVNLLDFLIDEDRKQALLNEIKSKSKVENFEIQAKTSSGKIKWLAVTAKEKDEHIEGFLVDITRLKLTEEQLKESENSKAAILSAVPDTILVLDSSLDIKEVHSIDNTLYGRSSEWFIDKPINKIIPKSFYSEFKKTALSTTRDEVSQIEFPRQEEGGMQHYDCRIALLGRSHYLVFIRDITESYLEKEKIRYISAFEALITRLSTHFLELPTEQFDQGISIALETIANFADVDSAYILLFPTPNEQDLSYYWSKRSEKEVLRMKKMLRLNTFPNLRKQLQNEHIVKIDDIKMLSKVAPKEYELLKTEGVKSFVVIPMMRGNDLIGALGMVTFRKFHLWPDELDSLLKIASEMFTNALMRKNIDEQVNSLYESQSKLFSQIAHSLKTPFTVALSSLELLKTSSTEKRNEYINTIKSNLRESTAIVNQLLKIAKMDLFPVGAKPNSIRLDSLLEMIFSKAAVLYRSHFPEVSEKELEESFTKDTFDQAEIFGDKRSLTEAILILIDNAFRHSPRTGEKAKVHISGKLSGSTYKIIIKDKGKGIPKNELGQIFDLYYQGSGSGEGSGIGLAFCKKVIESLGGKISINSRVGKGTEAEITFSV